MNLYHTPGGTWAGTEKDFYKALKAEGIDPKTYDGRRQIDVPTDKKGLMEFLTFHSVNCINGSTPAASATPDLPAIQAQVDGAPLAPVAPAPVVFASGDIDLDALFMAAPLGQQLTLAQIAIENAFQNQRPRI